MTFNLAVNTFKLVHKVHTAIKINKLENKNKANNFILKYYLNVFQTCNNHENIFNNWKKSMRPNEEINMETILSMVREQVKLIKIFQEKRKQSQKLHLKIPNPRANIVKILIAKFMELDKGIKEVQKIRFLKTGIFKQIKCQAYNSIKKEWYVIDKKYVYMFYFLYINYLKKYIIEYHRYLLYVRKCENKIISQQKEGEVKQNNNDDIIQTEGQQHFICPLCNKKVLKNYCVTHINQCAIINKK